MAGSDDFGKELDKLIVAMMLKEILSEKEDVCVKPFTVEVAMTEHSLSCGTSVNKKFFNDIEGGMEWVEETNELIGSIMAEQTTKLSKLLQKSFGIEVAEEISTPTGETIGDILKNLFGGAIVQTKNNLPVITRTFGRQIQK